MKPKNWKKVLRKVSAKTRDNHYYTVIDSSFWVNPPNEFRDKSFLSNSLSHLNQDLSYTSERYYAIEKSLNSIKQLNEKVFNDIPDVFSQGNYCKVTHVTSNDYLSKLEDFNAEFSLAHKKNVFGQILIPEAIESLEKFNSLIQEYKVCQSADTFGNIYYHLLEIEILAKEKLNELGKQAKRIRRKIALYYCNRNLRSHFRHIIQFLFKNMDDESDSALVAVYSNSISPQFLNKQKWKHYSQ